MRKIINLKNIVVSIFFFSFACAISSCDDWTSQESLDIKVPTIENENNELYQQYLENLRNYKKTYHQLLIGWFDNSDKSYVSQGMHLSSLPDKVDIVSLMSPDNLNETELAEINVLRKDKGTKVIYTIDYDAIARNINSIISDANEAAQENPETVIPDFFELLDSELDKQFTVLSKYNYDGLCIGYIGFSSQFPTAIDAESTERIQNMIFSRLNKVWTEVRLFAGLPENIIDRSRLEQFDYIVLQTQSALDMSMIDILAHASIQADVPADRIIVSALPKSLDPTDTKTGVFSDGSNAIVSTAKWMKTSGTFTKAGLAVYNINNDYYNSESDYKSVRDAIEIMNPSPKK